ncbi:MULTISPECIES: sirohydrochlorin chelatase [unclassified Corynebacterium]|uniref:sirohydrochlorin chelatase n=1 Tax=unclassified Corynebacterium TaxID=2624378 RepID=UPI0008A15837|nr:MULTISPECIES: sirohydrochlorin chelatase [unclassified Corynebacterium]OFP35560.1 hypothetical protein HMPREF2990_08355 [Corynebacterium sp. HMSC071B10]OHF38629.1 hypothetical protein HMPREF2550_02385 [Corynebacterium sp. HMSC074A01]
MVALITLSHGSRHPRARAGVRALTEVAAQRIGAPWVDAHLEFDRPDLEGAACELASRGADRAVVVPLLFTHAFHAKNDVPAHMRAAGEFLPLTQAPSLGLGEELVDLLAAQALADAPPHAHLVVYPVGTSDAGQAARYEEVRVGVEKRTGRPTEVIAATRGGAQALAERARATPIHLLPLFVSDGLLLDKALAALAPFPEATASGPLTTALADIVVNRYRAALEGAPHV